MVADDPGAVPARTPLVDLVADPRLAISLSFEEAMALLAQVGALEAILRARLASGPSPVRRTDQPAPSKATIELLTLDDAVKKSRKSRRWFLDHWRELPFARKIGRKILFSERDFNRWLGSR
jgi:hypothetical protein